jgi:hypothetical protein
MHLFFDNSSRSLLSETQTPLMGDQNSAFTPHFALVATKKYSVYLRKILIWAIKAYDKSKDSRAYAVTHLFFRDVSSMCELIEPLIDEIISHQGCSEDKRLEYVDSVKKKLKPKVAKEIRRVLAGLIVHVTLCTGCRSCVDI